jgi:hypothetical protein
MIYRVLLYIIYACVDCTLHIGFLNDGVIGCMVVPFHTLSYRSITLIRLDVLCLVDMSSIEVEWHVPLACRTPLYTLEGYDGYDE